MTLASTPPCSYNSYDPKISLDSSALPISHRLSSRPCSGCSSLSIDKLRKSASISLKENFSGLDRDQLLTPPIFLNFQRIQHARSSCPLCMMIFSEIQEKIPVGEEVISAYRCEDLEHKLQSVWIYHTSNPHPLAKVYCHANEGSYASQHVAYRPISPPGSETAISRIKSWIQDCSTNHTECMLALSGTLLDYVPMLPTRVLDVQNYPFSLRLIISNSKKASYVALSHCWGGKLQLRTTKETLARHQKHISCEDLSETIRDAAWVTKALDISYLWVDCLCIIQEDEVDFGQESRRMASVYEHSFLTIAATGARDGTGGLFIRSPKESYVEVPCDPEDSTLGYMYLGPQKEPEETIFGAPLNKRGWVLQENIFARRTVHFASNQVYWECHETFMGEDNTSVTSAADMVFPNRALLSYVLDGFRGVRRSANSKGINDMNKFVDVYSIWAQLVRYYSTRELTNVNDKLPAIFSLSLELERILSRPFKFHEGVLFGPPYVELQGLLWRAQHGASLQRPAQRRAPLWSWASLDGAIDFIDMIYENRRRMDWFVDLWHPCDKDLKVLGVRAHRPTKTTSCQALLLEGTALECFATKGSHYGPSGQHGNNQLARVYNEQGECIEGELHYDVTSDQPDRVWLVPVFTRWRSKDATSPVYYCLMVKEAVDHPFKGRVFERVGAGMVLDVKWFCSCERGFLAVV